MESLEDERNNQLRPTTDTMTTPNPSPTNDGDENQITATVELPQIPIEIIFEILSRLPAKSLLQFSCVSKLWLSLISDPSLINLHFTRTINDRPDGSGLFLSAYNKSSRDLFFLSASHRGGPVTHLLTLSNSAAELTEAEHLNGLVLYRSQNGFVRHNFAYVCNPSTRKAFKLPGKAATTRYSYGNVHVCYMFGFDQFANEYKILNIRLVGIRSSQPTKIECGIFSLSTYSWKKIDLQFPFKIEGDEWFYGCKNSVCVNSVIHLMLENEILAFDLRKERFSIMHLPPATLPSELISYYRRLKFNQPYLIKINGLLGLICHDHIVENNTMDIWVLEDYENQVWVKDSIAFPAPWVDIGSPYPLDTIQTGELMFTPQIVYRTLVSITFFDMKKRSFRTAFVSLLPECLCSDEVEVEVARIRNYVESIMPLGRNG